MKNSEMSSKNLQKTEVDNNSSNTPIQTVEQMLEAIATGDRQTFLNLQTEDVTWEVDGNLAPIAPNTFKNVDIIPFAGSWFAPEGLNLINRTTVNFFDRFQQSLGIFKFEPLDFFQDDDRVVARVNLEAVVKETGLPFEIDMAFDVELEDSEKGIAQIDSVEVIYNSLPVAEAFAGQTPSLESVEIATEDLITGEPQSIKSNANSEESLQVVENAFQDFIVGNIEQFSKAFADDAILAVRGDSNLLPQSGIWEGPKGIQQFFAKGFEAFTPTVFLPEFIANGDRVAVSINQEGVDSENNFNFKFDSVHFLTVDDGLITNYEILFDSYISASAKAGEPLFLENELPTSEPEPLSVESKPVLDSNNDDTIETSLDFLSLNEIFHESYYLEINPEAAQAVANGEFTSGLEHFKAVGIDEGLRFTPLIDIDYYKRVANPDLSDLNNRQALDHLLKSGIEQDRTFSPFIDLNLYKEVNPELSNISSAEAFIHLQNIGINKGLQFSSFVNLEEFKSSNKELTNLSNFDAFTELATFYAPEEEGRIRVPLGQGLSVPGIVEIITPDSLAGSGEVRFTYSKSDDKVIIDINKEGLPFRPSFTRPEDISTPFNEQPVSIEDANWQTVLVGRWFDIESTFWYDGQTGQLLGNEFDLNFDLVGGRPNDNSPIDINGDGIEDIAQNVPVVQAVGTPIFEGNPDGRLNTTFQFDYDQILDERGTAGFYATTLPFNLNQPEQIGIYYTEGGLPVSEAMNWDDIISGIRSGNNLLHLTNTLVPASKPDFLDSRTNQMEGPLLFYPDIIPDGIVFEAINNAYRFADSSELETFIGGPPFPGRVAFQNGELELGLDLSTNGKNGGLVGGRANDRLNASFGKGKNKLYGESGDDELFAGKRDRLFGGNGNDTLDASFGNGRNILNGEIGDDWLFAGKQDRLFGGNGNDTLDASFGASHNYLDGGEGSDELFAGKRDRLLGKDGDDAFFVTDGGNNLITGGEGADAFWIATGEMVTTPNTITDFKIDTDVIGIAGIGATSVDELEFSQIGDDAVISFSGFDLATLSHTQVSDLQSSDVFVFA